MTLSYFRTLGIQLREGRTFLEEDIESPLSFAVVSESTARVLWPEGSSIGNRFRMQGRGPPQEFEVLGTVADTKQISLDSPVQNQVYLLNAKQPSYFLDFAVRARASPLALAEPIRKRAHALDPNLPIEDIVTMETRLASSISQVRLNTFFLTSFGLVTILIATVGVHGVISYLVALRSPELAIRHALGAAQSSLVKEVTLGRNERRLSRSRTRFDLRNRSLQISGREDGDGRQHVGHLSQRRRRSGHRLLARLPPPCVQSGQERPRGGAPAERLKFVVRWGLPLPELSREGSLAPERGLCRDRAA